MKSKRTVHIKSIVLPCLWFSLVAGVFTGVLIFLFKLAGTAVIGFSEQIYSMVRQSPEYLPLLCAAVLVIGLAITIILRWEPSCRGGGIPTAVALLRGLITCRWLRTLIAVFFSSMLTYFGGVPLGTEGPSVQMGALAGHGTVHLFARDNHAWDRYIMTGGSCAGFACATGAPLTGILFALEEAHRCFSPMIFMTAASAVASGATVSNLLCIAAGIPSSLFELDGHVLALPVRYLWIAPIIGIICGLLASALSLLYRLVRRKAKELRLPLAIKVLLILLCTVLAGYASANLIGTGHGLIDQLLEGHGVWYLSLLYLSIRAILLIVATNIGITGGLFIPSLAFGALIGSICANALITVGILPAEHEILLVTIGMAAFLSSFSHTPLMAIAFAFEALGGISNLLSMTLAVAFAYIVIEIVRIPPFVESIVESNWEAKNAGKTLTVLDERITVAPHAFIVGKEVRDILWPPACTVLSVVKNPEFESVHDFSIHPGDVLHIRCRSFDPDETHSILDSILGGEAAKQ